MKGVLVGVVVLFIIGSSSVDSIDAGKCECNDDQFCHANYGGNWDCVWDTEVCGAPFELPPWKDPPPGYGLDVGGCQCLWGDCGDYGDPMCSCSTEDPATCAPGQFCVTGLFGCEPRELGELYYDGACTDCEYNDPCDDYRYCVGNTVWQHVYEPYCHQPGCQLVDIEILEECSGDTPICDLGECVPEDIPPEPDCELTDVSIAPNCGEDECQAGETVAITFTASAACAAADHIQVDAVDSKDHCDVQYNIAVGDLSGVWNDNIDLTQTGWRLKFSGSSATCYADDGGKRHCNTIFSSQSACQAETDCTAWDDDCWFQFGDAKTWGVYNSVYCEEVDLAGDQTLTVSYTIPEVPFECEGETVDATFAALWRGSPGIGDRVSDTPSAEGSITFEVSCDKYNDWEYMDTVHAWCNPVQEGCVRDGGNDPEKYDQYCNDVGIVKPVGITIKSDL